LNAAAGSPCILTSDTYLLVERLVDSWWSTGGRFDPTVHDTMLAYGYTDSWPFRLSDAAPEDASPTPGCAGITLDRPTRMVWLPRGLHLDPGGLGKGLAADLIAEELIEDGAVGALVDLGGDVRVIGVSPNGGSWRIAVEHPANPAETIAIVETNDGGIATSSRGKRRWRTDDGREVHHLIDPALRAPSSRRWMSATALGSSAAAAEVGAKVAFLDGSLAAAPDVLAALLADADGHVESVGEHTELFAVTVSTVCGDVTAALGS
jgi:thiamine biosynthesis lipoprotein